MPFPKTLPALAVDESAHWLKQIGRPVNFVEDDELGCLPLEEQLGFLQLGPVLR